MHILGEKLRFSLRRTVAVRLRCDAPFSSQTALFAENPSEN